MKTKKGSKQHRELMSRLQKKAWKRRRKVKDVSKVEVKATEHPRDEFDPETFEEEKPESSRAALREWIDAASSLEERAKRKTAMLGIMYGSSADGLANSIFKMSPNVNVLFKEPRNYEEQPVKPGSWQLVESVTKRKVSVDGLNVAIKQRDEARHKLSQIKDTIDLIENRCLAADGPVTNTRFEMTDEELRFIYTTAGGVIHD